MAACKHTKRIQIYLDGWLDKSEAESMEKHLQKCLECQNEMFELEEVASAALENYR